MTEKNMHKFLTIVIPTYNRERQLIRLLQSIERQDAVDKYYVVILNNHSDYDVKEALSKAFSGDFLDNIVYYDRPYNAGGDYNIGSAFLFAKTDYLWIIGDDDEVLDGCFDIIGEDIAKYPDIPYFKYHIQTHSSYDEDLIISDIDEFKRHFYQKRFCAGDVLFVSNNVYNLRLAGDYVPTSLYYSYCSIPHALPMLRCLADKRPFVWSHREIVSYHAPEGDHWNYVKIATSFSTVLDIQAGADYATTERFFRILSQHFEPRDFLAECLKVKDKRYARYVCRKGMATLFRNRFLASRYCRFLYGVERATGIKALTRHIRNKEWLRAKRRQFIDSDNFLYRTYRKLKNK